MQIILICNAAGPFPKNFFRDGRGLGLADVKSAGVKADGIEWDCTIAGGLARRRAFLRDRRPAL